MCNCAFMCVLSDVQMCVCVVGMHAPVTERCECVFAYLREYTLSSVCVCECVLDSLLLSSVCFIEWCMNSWVHM